MACFVLVQAYSSTLIAFITLSNNKPIINSVYDISNVPGLKITVNRNFGADVMLRASCFLKLNNIQHSIYNIHSLLVNRKLNFCIFKKLGDSLGGELRCNKTELCLDKVQSGNYVYIHVSWQNHCFMFALLQIIFDSPHYESEFCFISVSSNRENRSSRKLLDREQTGPCHFTMASESFWSGHLYFFLPKKSHYTETINRGYKIVP